MRVDVKIKEEWAELRLAGDIQAIANENPHLKKEAIRVCVTEGEFRNWDVFETVFKFYYARKTQLESMAETAKIDA